MTKKILLLFLGVIFIFSGCADKNVKSESKSIPKNFRAISVDKAEILQSGKIMSYSKTIDLVKGN